MGADPDDGFSVLCAAIGPEASARLSAAASGCWVYVPERPAPGSGLARLIGVDAVAAAIAAVGPGEVYVRKVADRAARDAAIRRARAEGQLVREIAVRFGVSQAKVKQVLTRG